MPATEKILLTKQEQKPLKCSNRWKFFYKNFFKNSRFVIHISVQIRISMTEDFLHYIWKHRLFDKNNLETTQGEKISVEHPGTHNINAGPDFFNAKIKIGKTLWAGNVEIHQRSSDWEKHFHQADKEYDNVILHVVDEDDAEIKRNDKT